MLETKTYKSSVLITNYNNYSYLEQCINSILEQTFKNIEIIVIDDSSTDNSIEILDKFKNSIKIVKKRKSKTGVGCYDQILSYFECLKNSSGDIIHLCDSDDYFKKNKIERIIQEFKKTNAILVYDLPILKFQNKLKIVKNKRKFINNYWSYFPPTSCISIRRKEFINNFELLNKMDFPDVWLDFRLGILSKYFFKDFNVLNENLTYYRQTDSNVSSKFKYLSKNWWIRRSQAHDYVKYFFDKNSISYNRNLDFFLTKSLTKLFYE